MTIVQKRKSASHDEALLDFIDERVRELQEQAVEPRYVVVGPSAYEVLCRAMGERFGRSAGLFETYQWLSIVVDPFRGEQVCVLPSPAEVAAGVRTEER